MHKPQLCWKYKCVSALLSFSLSQRRRSVCAFSSFHTCQLCIKAFHSRVSGYAHFSFYPRRNFTHIFSSTCGRTCATFCSLCGCKTHVSVLVNNLRLLLKSAWLYSCSFPNAKSPLLLFHIGLRRGRTRITKDQSIICCTSRSKVRKTTVFVRSQVFTFHPGRSGPTL
jgi:hypothetical protein